MPHNGGTEGRFPQGVLEDEQRQAAAAGRASRARSSQKLRPSRFKLNAVDASDLDSKSGGRFQASLIQFVSVAPSTFKHADPVKSFTHLVKTLRKFSKLSPSSLGAASPSFNSQVGSRTIRFGPARGPSLVLSWSCNAW
eukprot:200964-Pyramimonas_sp.AAC.1